MSARWVACVVLAVLGGCALGCGSGERTAPNILFVVVDTLRADHTSLYGYERETTPNLDAFASGALVFENARASSSWTKPSTASMLTGLTAAQHGVDGTEARLPEAATTIAEVLGVAGYRTGLFSDNPIVSRAFGFAQGYQYAFDFSRREHVGSKTASFVDVGGERVRANEPSDWTRRYGARLLNTELLAWLEGFGESQPWFAHVQYMDAHWPHAPPAAFRDRFRSAAKGTPALIGDWASENGLAPVIPGTVLEDVVRQDRIDLYDGSIAYWDEQFGELLARLGERGRLRNSIVVVVSDHGEGFYEHKIWDHQNSLYEELVRVPLLLRGPGIEAGRDARDVSSTHLPATLLGLAGIGSASIADGTTLFAPPTESWTAYLERKGRTFRATVEDGHKWVFSERDDERVTEVFDLAADPSELRDLSRQLAARAEEVRTRLVLEFAAERAAGLGNGGDAEISEPMANALRALGYGD